MNQCNGSPVIDDRSKNLNLPLPHPANRGLVDVIRLREALGKIDEQVVAKNDNEMLRTPCAKSFIVYVRIDGDDNNDGLSATTAKKTVAAARDALLNVDGRGYHPIIDIGPGTFESGQINFYSWNDAVNQNVYLRGAGKDVTILKNLDGSIIIAAIRMVLGVSGMTLQGTVFSTESGFINLHNDIALGPVRNTEKHLVASRGGILLVNTSVCDVHGDSNTFINAANGGTVEVVTASINFINSPTFSAAVCDSYGQGNILWSKSNTYTGTPVGKRFIADTGGVIHCFGSKPNSFLPGTIDGEIRTNGVIGGQTSGRIPCKAALTLYVRTDGNDGNDGLSVATAKKTVAAARDALLAFDGRGYNPVIDIGPGIFESGSIDFHPHHRAINQRIYIRGAGKGITVLKNSTGYIIKSFGAYLNISEMSLQGVLVATEFAFIYLQGNIAIGPVLDSYRHLEAHRSGVIYINTTTCDVYGDSKGLMLASGLSGGCIEVLTTGINLMGNPTFSSAVCEASNGGVIAWDKSRTYTGTAVGKRFTADTGGIISCGSAHPNSFLPGTIDGEIRTNGVIGGQTDGQISCKANLTLYVRIDGNDVNDGSADTPQKAFRTVQKALNHVSDNYNLGSYNATIKIGPGSFSGFILPKYTASTGSVIISGNGKTSTTIEATNTNIISSSAGAGNYRIEDLTVKLTSTKEESDPASFMYAIIAFQGVTITLNNVLGVANEGQANSQANMYFLEMQSGGRIIIGNGNEFLMNGRTSTSCLIACNVIIGGYLRLNGSTSINGVVKYTLRAFASGFFDRAPSHPQFTGNVTGQRYLVSAGSCVNTVSGGPNFFPGSIAGVAEASTYGIYL